MLALAAKDPNQAGTTAKLIAEESAPRRTTQINSTRREGRPVVVSVEAAIGTGKSSLLRLLQNTLGSNGKWIVVQEPVDQWQSVGGEHNLLEAYYADQSRFAFSFQTNCVLSRITAVQKALDTVDDHVEVVILERCWASDRNTFAEMLKARNKISPMEWALYDEWYNFACRNAPIIDGHLYLECSTDTCMARLRKRDRTEEVGVTEDYQRELIDRHETWLASLPTATVCRIPVDQDFINDAARSVAVLDTIQAFVASLGSSS